MRDTGQMVLDAPSIAVKHMRPARRWMGVTYGCHRRHGDTAHERRTSMSRRTNGTNRAGAALGVNLYTGKLAPRKKKNLTAATVQVQELKNINLYR